MKTEALVNELTGEELTLGEMLRQMRELDRAVARLDDTIASLSASRKAAKESRDKAMAELRSLAREVKLRSESKRHQGPAPRTATVLQTQRLELQTGKRKPRAAAPTKES